MSLFPSRKIFLSAGPFTITWYAVLILTGAIITYLFSRKDARETKYLERDDFFDDVYLCVLWVGIIGARIWYCLFYPEGTYLENPSLIIRIWDGGLAIHGGIIFGLITAFIMCKIRNVSFFKVLDTILPNVLIAQAIGRWGNFVNKECHGIKVDESYFDGILFFLKDGMKISGSYYVPLFFYESLLCLLGFILIRYVIKRFQNKRGDLAFAYIMWYGIVRLYIESSRTDSLMIGSIKIAQLISIIGIIVGIAGYLGFFNLFIKKKKPVIIFDYDLTLVDTSMSIKGGFMSLFEKYDKPENFTIEKQDKVMGPPLSKMIKEFFPNEDTDKLCQEYREKNYELQLSTNKIYPNEFEVIKKLHEDGYKIAIASNRSSDSIGIGLKQFELEPYIDCVVGLKEVKNLKPDPECIFNIIKKNKWNYDEVIYVGDSVGDIECGHNYGAYTVAFHSSELREEELLKTNANKHMYDYKELLDIVNESCYFTYNNR